MAELSIEEFKQRYGEGCAAIIQIAFFGDADHSENIEIETIARKQSAGDCCFVNNCIVLSNDAALQSVEKRLPKRYQLHDVMDKLRMQADYAQLGGAGVMRRTGYAQADSDSRFRGVQAMFFENTGFRADKIFSAIKNVG